MRWLAASISPSLSFLITGAIRPGVSMSSVLPSSSKRLCCRVTAGSSPVFAALRLSSALMSVDLPTFGTPITMMRTGFNALLRCGASAAARRGTFATSPERLHDSATARTSLPAS